MDRPKQRANKANISHRVPRHSSSLAQPGLGSREVNGSFRAPHIPSSTPGAHDTAKLLQELVAKPVQLEYGG